MEILNQTVYVLNEIPEDTSYVLWGYGYDDTLSNNRIKIKLVVGYK